MALKQLRQWYKMQKFKNSIVSDNIWYLLTGESCLKPHEEYLNTVFPNLFSCSAINYVMKLILQD